MLVASDTTAPKSSTLSMTSPPVPSPTSELKRSRSLTCLRPSKGTPNVDRALREVHLSDRNRKRPEAEDEDQKG